MLILENILNWLLEKNNPYVHYLTLTNLLKKPAKSLEVQEIKANLMEYNVSSQILEHSKNFCEDDDRAYWKYTGKYWQLIFLGHFLADRTDPCIAEGVEDIIAKRKWITKSGW